MRVVLDYIFPMTISPFMSSTATNVTTPIYSIYNMYTNTAYMHNTIPDRYFVTNMFHWQANRTGIAMYITCHKKLLSK